jgi:CBS domain-containing protein
MTTPVITIREDAEIGKAADIMMERNVSCLPVVNDKFELVGMLTHSDFGLQKIVLPHGETAFAMLGFWTDPKRIEEVTAELRKRKVKDVMSKPVTTVNENTPAADVFELMVGRRVNRLPVMRGKEIVGIVTRHDLLKLMTTGHELLAEMWTPAIR